MKPTNTDNAARSYAEVPSFQDIIRAWCGQMPQAVAARHLRISPRTLAYWLDGKRPSGSLLALVERPLARAAGITVEQLREAAGHRCGGRYALPPSREGATTAVDSVRL